MSLDPVRNFASVTPSSVGYDTDDTAIALSTGDGSKLPDPATEGAFNLVWYNWTDYPDPTDDPAKEIVRVTARTGDDITVARAQEGTTANLHNTTGKTYKMILAVTRKMIEDIGNQSVSFAFADNETPTGSIPGTAFTIAHTPITDSLRLYRNGVLQIEGTNYTLTGANITMVNTVNAGNTFKAFYRYNLS